MNEVQKVEQLIQNLKTVLQHFASANWPDTRTGNAAYNLFNNLELIEKRLRRE